MKKLQYLRWGLLVILAVTALATGWKIAATSKNTASERWREAPDFTLTSINGQNVRLKDIIGQNKVTLVNFWATWCPPCRNEIPELIELYRKYGPKKMALLAVDLQEDPAIVKAFVKEKKINFPVLIDFTGQVANQYQVSGIPTTFIIDRQGKIRHFITGRTTLKALEAKVAPLLK